MAAAAALVVMDSGGPAPVALFLFGPVIGIALRVYQRRHARLRHAFLAERASSRRRVWSSADPPVAHELLGSTPAR